MTTNSSLILETNTDPLACRVTTGLVKISMALRSRAWREAGAHGISPTQGQILVFLRSQPNQNTQNTSLTLVAYSLGITPPTASEAVRVLASKGLVRKVHSNDDARTVSIALSAKGRRKAERAASWSGFLTVAAKTLTPEEQEIFLRALVKMIRTLQDGDEIPATRMCVTCTYFRPNVHDDPQQPHHCAFVDAPFGDRLLRIDCPDHEPAGGEQRDRNWHTFAKGGS